MTSTCDELVEVLFLPLNYIFKTNVKGTKSMKLFCCKDEAYCYLGALFLVAVLLTACAGDNNGNVIGPDAQNEISSSSLSSGAEPGEFSLDASSSSQKTAVRTIHGFAQRTPFVDGSVVQLTALDESTLEPIGETFTGIVDGGFSRYSVEVDSLKSRYVQISVTGDVLSYYNSMPEEKEYTLYAITDLDSRDSVNINLLTHLEFDRVRKLVRDDKLSFAEAKKQAEKELFEIFHITMEKSNDAYFAEDWSLFGDSLGDQALMGLTVIFNIYKATIYAFSDFFAKDGKIVNDTIIYKMAQTAFNSGVVRISGDIYLSPDLNRFRSSFNRWKSIYGTSFDMNSVAYHGMIPEFEEVVENFWRSEFGLEKCDKEHLGTVGKTRYDEYYTCAQDFLVGTVTNSEYYWRVANSLEANSYGIKCDSADYFIMPGGVNSSLIVCDLGSWRYALDVEKQVGLCTNENEGSLEDTDKYGYVCKSNKWEVFTDTLEDERDGKRYAYSKAAGLYWMIDDLGDTIFAWAEVQCPEGWRLPTFEDWHNLWEKLGGWRIPSTDGHQMHLIDGAHSFKMWWTSSESTEDDLFAIAFVAEYSPMDYLQAQYFSLGSRSELKSRKNSVRCVKEP